jgi:putative peptidoglycan lipid II flippase
MLLLNRAFFSLQSNWIPTIVALANLFLNAVFDLAFYHLGAWGIPLSTAVVNIAGTAVLLVLMSRRLHGIEAGPTARTTAKVLVASAAVAAVSFGIWLPLDSELGRSFVAQLISVGCALLAAGAVYVAICRALGVRELGTLLALSRRRATPSGYGD